MHYRLVGGRDLPLLIHQVEQAIRGMDHATALRQDPSPFIRTALSALSSAVDELTRITANLSSSRSLEWADLQIKVCTANRRTAVQFGVVLPENQDSCPAIRVTSPTRKTILLPVVEMPTDPRHVLLLALERPLYMRYVQEFFQANGTAAGEFLHALRHLKNTL